MTRSSLEVGTMLRLATPDDSGRWNEFVESAPDGNFYQRFEWLDINQKALGHDTLPFMAERDGKVVGVFPLIRVRSLLFGDILSSMPFVNFGGPASTGPEVESALLGAAFEEAERIGCDYVEIRSTRRHCDLPVDTRKVSMTLELPAAADDLWKSFSSKHRNNILRARRSELEVQSGGRELLTPFYRVMERGWRGLGTPLFRRSYFKEILSAFGRDATIFVATHRGTPVAAALNGSFQGTCEGMWAATDPAYHGLQANYVLYWEMMVDACDRGLTRYHLGRSTAGSGAQRFKERWGAAPTQLYWNHRLVRASEPPSLNPDNARYRHAIRAWRRLPLAVTRRLGPPIARSIP